MHNIILEDAKVRMYNTFSERWIIKMKELTVPEGDCFSTEYTVNYSEISSKRTLQPSSLINYFQNLAVLHSDSLGYTLGWFHEHNLGWVLLSWHVDLREMPREGTKLTAETWTSPHKRSQANREFALKDEQGTVIARAASRWVLMNTSRRRPAKLDAGFFNKYSFENGRFCADEDHIINFPEDAELISSYSIPVMRRDTDTNKHANNAVYIDWALDGVPDEIYDTCCLTELTVHYKKECRRGDQVRSTLYKNGNDILCVLVDDNDPVREFGRLLMRWE